MKFVLWLGIVIGGLWLVTQFVVQPFSIPSDSMEPGLEIGDRIAVNKMAYLFAPIERGDIVVFNGQDSFSSGDKDYVKRVIGIGGDRVVCCDEAGRITVNGESVNEGAYLDSTMEPSGVTFDVEVPEGKLWLMGDNRANSADSRSHLGDPGGGFVSQSKVEGKAMAVIWPPQRIKVLD